MGSCPRCTGVLQHPTCSDTCPLQSQPRGVAQSRGQGPRFCPQEPTNHCGNRAHPGSCTLDGLKEHRQGQDFPPNSLDFFLNGKHVFIPTASF